MVSNVLELRSVIKRQEAELSYALHQCAIGWRQEDREELRLKIMEIGRTAEKVAKDCIEALQGFTL